MSELPEYKLDRIFDAPREMVAGMDKGWGSGYKIMDELFVELQSENN